MLSNLNYPQLVQLKRDLQTHVPSDPSFISAAGVLLRALIEDLIGAAKEKHEQEQQQVQQAQEQQTLEHNPEQAVAETVGEDDSEHEHRRRRR